jgi:membrane-bound inhibitor of C-type lysozyme
MKRMLGQKAGLTSLVVLASLGLLPTGVTPARQTPSTRADPAKPAAIPGPTNNVRPAIKWKRFDYTCESGAKITVYLHDTVAKIRTKDRIYLMRQTSSASADGNRYSDGKILWWGRDETGFLQEDTPDGDGKMLVKGCTLDKPPEAPKP